MADKQPLYLSEEEVRAFARKLYDDADKLKQCAKRARSIAYQSPSEWGSESGPKWFQGQFTEEMNTIAREFERLEKAYEAFADCSLKALQNMYASEDEAVAALKASSAAIPSYAQGGHSSLGDVVETVTRNSGTGGLFIARPV